MREIPRAAVIATHNRPAELRRCVEAIAPQVDTIVIIDNASDPPVNLPCRIEGGRDSYDLDTIPLRVMLDPEQPPNLSRLWNRGLDYVAEYFRGGDIDAYDVAVLNDDAVPPAGWFDAVAGAMREEGADAASSDPFDRLAPGERHYLWGGGVPMGVETRLAGWAMTLRGEWSGAHFDEQLRWWAQDDDLSHRARLAGGLVHVGGYPVPNTLSDTTTVGVLAEQAARDMQTFVDKWGRRPW